MLHSHTRILAYDLGCSPPCVLLVVVVVVVDVIVHLFHARSMISLSLSPFLCSFPSLFLFSRSYLFLSAICVAFLPVPNTILLHQR